LIAVCETSLVVVLVDNTAIKVNIDSLSDTIVKLPQTVVPVSIAFARSGDILIGAANGHLLRYSQELALSATQQVSGRRVVLHSLDGGIVVGSGSPPFQWDDNRVSLSSCDCEDIAMSGDYISCLHSKWISIARLTPGIVSSCRFLVAVPGIVRAVGSLFDRSDVFCLTESPEMQQSVVKYRGATVVAKYEQAKRWRISMFRSLEFEGRLIVIIDDDKPSITLLDDELRVVASQKMIGLPTAACIYLGFLAIAPPASVDYFTLKDLDGDYEMERKVITDGPSLAPDLIVVKDFLIASDHLQSLVVYKAEADSVVWVADDTLPKRLNKLASLNDFIFASSYSDVVYCYRLGDDWSVFEVSAFQCDSHVFAFCPVENKLFYGTAGGGIGPSSPLRTMGSLGCAIRSRRSRSR
jgi:hypothetical protein